MAEDSQLEKKLNQYPRWARIIIGLVATTLILAVPAAVVGFMVGDLMEVLRVTGMVVGAIYGLKISEYLVTEALKQLL